MVSAIPPRPLRLRSPGHLAFVRTLRCAICGRQPSDPHHLKHVQPRAKSLKSGDQWTVPLCRRHHTDVEMAGNEALWWLDQNMDPAPLATELWAISRARDGKGARCPSF